MRLKLCFYDTPLNKYSVTALLGAMEADEELAEGADVLFFADAEELERREEELKGFGTVVLAFSFFSSQIWEMREMLRRLEPLRQRTGAVTVGGGPHVSGDGERSVTVLGFDYALMGEGEESFPALLRALAEGRDPAGMPGLCCRNAAGALVNGGQAPRVEIDRFDPVAPRYRRYGPIEITRGCPYGCCFCQTGDLCGRKVRHRSIASIEEVMVRASELFKLRFFRALTPNALSYGSPDGVKVNLPALEELFAMLRRVLGENGQIYMGYFPSEVRPNNVTEETVELLGRYVFNRDIVIGAQSGSDRLLRHIHRGHTAQQVMDAVELLHRGGFIANVDFIFGLPGEEEEDIRLSLEMIRELAAKGAKLNVHSFMPLPQTRFALEEPGKISRETRELIGPLMPEGIVYGDWVNQAVQAEKMHRYFKTGEL